MNKYFINELAYITKRKKTFETKKDFCKIKKIDVIKSNHL